MLGVVLGAAPAAAHGCTVTATPAPGWPGASITVRGTGFDAGADITVYLGDFPVYDGFIPASGRFEIEMRIPRPFVEGEVVLAVVDHTGACDASTRYRIGPVPEREQIPLWATAVYLGVGLALGFGLAGVALRRRH